MQAAGYIAPPAGASANGGAGKMRAANETGEGHFAVNLLAFFALSTVPRALI